MTMSGHVKTDLPATIVSAKSMNGDFLSFHLKEVLKLFFCIMETNILLYPQVTRYILKRVMRILNINPESIKYKDYQWMICGDLKILCMLLGKQDGYNKFPCFWCEQDTRARNKHWEQEHQSERKSFQPGSKKTFCVEVLQMQRKFFCLLFT